MLLCAAPPALVTELPEVTAFVLNKEEESETSITLTCEVEVRDTHITFVRLRRMVHPRSVTPGAMSTGSWRTTWWRSRTPPRPRILPRRVARSWSSGTSSCPPRARCSRAWSPRCACPRSRASVTYHRAMTEHYLQRTVLDMAADNFTVSCVSSDNGLGEPVSSTTTVSVQCELLAALFQICIM